MDEPAIRVEGLTKVYRLRGGSGELPFAARLNRRRARREGQVWEDDDDDFQDEDEDLEPRDEPTGEEKEIGALHDVSLEIAAGSRIALLGPTASGKSTLLKVIARITPPTEGRVEVRGRVAPLLGLASGVLEPNLTGRQNAYTLARLFGVPRSVVDRRLNEIFEFAGLPQRAHLRAGAYSSGQYRRLGLSIALNLEPDILLVDERLVSGDSEFAEQCAERLREMADAGLTLVFAANDVETVRSYCTEAVMLEDGRVTGRGPLEGVVSETPDRSQPAGPRRYTKERLDAVDELRPDDREFLTQLARGHATYASAAVEAGLDAAEVRERATSLLALLAPGGERLDGHLHDTIVDYALGQGPPPEPAQLAESPEARAWSRIVARQIGPLAPGPRPGLQPTLSRYDGFEPPPDTRGKLLIDYLEIAIGPERTLEAVQAATDKAIWTEQTSVGWQEIAEAAGLDHHREAKLINDRLMERVKFGRPALPDELPHRPPVAIRKTAVRSSDGLVREWVGTDERLHFEVSLDTRRPDLRLRCRISVEGQNASPLDLDQPEPFAADQPGRYVIRVRIPAGRLAEDRYYVHVTVEGNQLSDGMEEPIERATKRDVLRFDVREPAESADDDSGSSDGQIDEPVWQVSS